MIEGAEWRTDKQIMKDAFNDIEKAIGNIFVYYLNTDTKHLKMNIKIRKLHNKMKKMCRKYITKYFEIRGK